MVGFSSPNALKANIAPNPVKDYFSIQIADFSHTSKTHFQLRDVHGQVVFSKVLLNANATFSIEHLPVGLYFASITQNERFLYTSKLIKE